METLTNLLLFLALLGGGLVVFLVWSDRRRKNRGDEMVTVSSPHVQDIQSLQMELGLVEPISWNGYRNELCLYRIRMRREDAERVISRRRFNGLRIEY